MTSIAPPFDRFLHALDHTPWRVRAAEGGVEVASGFAVFGPGVAPDPCEGFRVTWTHAGITLDDALGFFHDACHFFSTVNEMAGRVEVVRVDEPSVERFRAVVRTEARLPWPLQDREYLHTIGTRVDADAAGRRRAVVAYGQVPARDAPAPWSGTLRCTSAPSGQRITELAGGGVEVVHCVTSPLGGGVPLWAQNSLFSRAHVKAYLEEGIATKRSVAAGGAAHG